MQDSLVWVILVGSNTVCLMLYSLTKFINVLAFLSLLTLSIFTFTSPQIRYLYPVLLAVFIQIESFSINTPKSALGDRYTAHINTFSLFGRTHYTQHISKSFSSHMLPHSNVLKFSSFLAIMHTPPRINLALL